MLTNLIACSRRAGVAFAMAAAIAVAIPAAAQNAGNLLGLTPEQLEMIQQGEAPALSDPALPEAEAVPVDPAAGAAGPSRIEEILSQRAGQPLRQFGYDALEGVDSVRVPQIGAGQDSYVLGPGDEIVVTLRGQENSNRRVRVDRNGQVLLPRLNPIPAAGRPFGEFRADAERQVAESFVATQAFLSLGAVRRISVYVVGEVNSPGIVTVTGLSTPMDALVLAGGVKRTGSLRDIRIVRGGQELPYDLYALLLGVGEPPAVALTEGDRIVVGALGRVIGLGGWVRRPGIYEMPRGVGEIAIEQAVALAGGLEVRGSYRYQLVTLRPDGRQEVLDLRAGSGRVMRDSDVLLAEPAVQQTVGQVQLLGSVPIAGRYGLGRSGSLKALLSTPGTLESNPYMLLGVVSRRDPQSMIRQLLAFSPANVLKGKQDLQLRNDDVVRVFSVNEARALSDAVVRARQQQDVLEQADKVRRLQQLNATPGTSAAGLLEGIDTGVTDAERRAAILGIPPLSPEPAQPAERSLAPSGPAPGAELKNVADIAEQLGIDPLVLIQFLSDHSATLSGAVRGPGTFLIADGTTLDQLVEAAGGPNAWADGSNIEITSTAVDPLSGRAETQRRTIRLAQAEFAAQSVRLQDVVLFQTVFTEVTEAEIRIEGQVRFPGTYRVLRGDKLSTVLARAGGLTEVAFPYGAVFLRQSAARLEREGNDRVAQEIETQIISAASDPDFNAAAGPALKELVTAIRSAPALGRISVQADPTTLAGSPEADMVLEDGDVLYIPSRPNTVQVSGQVLRPGAYQFASGQDANYYIELAGGVSRYSDEEYAFVVFPDGTARRLERSWLAYERASIPPGSVIVIPRDLAPFNFRRFALDVTQILQSLAVSAASLAVINSN